MTNTGHGLDRFGLDAKVLGVAVNLSKQNGGINSKTSYLQEKTCSIQEPPIHFVMFYVGILTKHAKSPGGDCY